MIDYKRLKDIFDTRSHIKLNSLSPRANPKDFKFGIDDVNFADYVVVAFCIHNMQSLERLLDLNSLTKIVTLFFHEFCKAGRSGNKPVRSYLDYDAGYTVFMANDTDEIDALFNTLALFNSLFRMFNILLAKLDYPQLEVGMSAVYYKNGAFYRTYENLQDCLWYLPSIRKALDLAKIAGTDLIQPIVIDAAFREKCKELYYCDELDDEDGGMIYDAKNDIYHMNIIYAEFSDWLDSLELD